MIYSYGGLQDHLIDPERHRHADVFSQHSDLAEQGYTDQSDSDLIAACAPSLRIGIPSNNIPAANKRFAGRPMSALHPNRKEAPDE